MPILTALAMTFQVTEFDIVILGLILFGVLILYYFVTLQKVYEAIFGVIV